MMQNIESQQTNLNTDELTVETNDILDVVAAETIESVLSFDEQDKIDPLFYDKLDDPDFLKILFEYCEATGESPKEFLVHSGRFSALVAARTGIFGANISIPEHDENVHANGIKRRTESGGLIDLNLVEQQGIDPAKVLFFRATQPSESPKPEYYWTSDLHEVKTGLNVELGATAETAIILVSTLDRIDTNGGLIRDVFNDDDGLAVRQVGLGPFDQQQAMGSFARAGV